VAGTATGYNGILFAVGLLRSANAPEPYALACNPAVRTTLERMQDTTGQTIQPPPGMPTIYTSTAVPMGTAFLYSPSQFAVVRRQDGNRKSPGGAVRFLSERRPETAGRLRDR